jgi:hypothetical protein
MRSVIIYKQKVSSSLGIIPLKATTKNTVVHPKNAAVISSLDPTHLLQTLELSSVLADFSTASKNSF